MPYVYIFSQMTKLAEYLKANGIRQSDFAVQAGLTQGAVSRLCTGAASVSLQTAFLIEQLTDGAVPAKSWTDLKKDAA
jgi:transcriptional regulator with XRE-family HTH domain